MLGNEDVIARGLGDLKVFQVKLLHGGASEPLAEGHELSGSKFSSMLKDELDSVLMPQAFVRCSMKDFIVDILTLAFLLHG